MKINYTKYPKEIFDRETKEQREDRLAMEGRIRIIDKPLPEEPTSHSNRNTKQQEEIKKAIEGQQILSFST